ncbi:hypothetical protein STIAU_4881, partial [Stigmatella aurantiaca DW4/3-1]
MAHLRGRAVLHRPCDERCPCQRHSPLRPLRERSPRPLHGPIHVYRTQLWRLGGRLIQGWQLAAPSGRCQTRRGAHQGHVRSHPQLAPLEQQPAHHHLGRARWLLRQRFAAWSASPRRHATHARGQSEWVHLPAVRRPGPRRHRLAADRPECHRPPAVRSRLGAGNGRGALRPLADDPARREREQRASARHAVDTKDGLSHAPALADGPGSPASPLATAEAARSGRSVGRRQPARLPAHRDAQRPGAVAAIRAVSDLRAGEGDPDARRGGKIHAGSQPEAPCLPRGSASLLGSSGRRLGLARVAERDGQLQVRVEAAGDGALVGRLLQPGPVRRGQARGHVNGQHQLPNPARRRRHPLLHRRPRLPEGQALAGGDQGHGGHRTRGERRPHQVRGREGAPGSPVVLRGLGGDARAGRSVLEFGLEGGGGGGGHHHPGGLRGLAHGGLLEKE